MIRALLFDAANTLIHKPDLWTRMNAVLLEHGYQVEPTNLKRTHKTLSECIAFPDKTDAGFYGYFNAELLLALGVIPESSLLDDLFQACTYLPYQLFEDVDGLAKMNLPVSVLSNFNSGLPSLLGELFPFALQHVISSEAEQLRKPDLAFYQFALDKLGLQGSEVLYVGDSLKLDIAPARKLGIEAFLIDRDTFYPAAKNRISTLHEVPALVNDLNLKQR